MAIAESCELWQNEGRFFETMKLKKYIKKYSKRAIESKDKCQTEPYLVIPNLIAFLRYLFADEVFGDKFWYFKVYSQN